jgi:hypothetical protein
MFSNVYICEIIVYIYVNKTINNMAKTEKPITKTENEPIAAVANTPESGIFQLKSKGLQEQFSNLDMAKRAYGKLKKQKLSEGGSFKIELLKKKEGSQVWETVDMIKISEDEE